MKQGQTIQDLSQILLSNDRNKRDFIAPISKLWMDNEAFLHMNDPCASPSPETGFDLTNWAAHQVAQWGGIPTGYYDKLAAQNKELLARNVNHAILHAKLVADVHQSSRPHQPVAPEERRLVRTIGGTARAFLSSRYRILDSTDLVNTILPPAIDNGLQIASCAITETRLFLKLTTPRIQAEVKKGDVVQYGISVSTSDVGAGAARVEPFILRLVCLNGMTAPDSSIRKFHIGRDMEADAVREVLSDATRAAEDTIFWAKVRDVFLHSLNQEVFDTLVDRLRVAAGEPIRNVDLLRVVELTSRAVGITGDETKNTILHSLAGVGDLSRWGLVNAFTAAANVAGDYDVATELERAGGKILDLSAEQWKVIAA